MSGGNGRRTNGFEECAFFLIKSDVRKSSVELANAIARIPGVEEVCFTEGKYSFLARFSGVQKAIERMQERLARNSAVLEIEKLNAPIIMKR